MKTQEAREMAEILVCDDDKDIVEAIEIYLAQEGHHILKAYDGEQAIRVLQNNPVDLLIIDVMMPKLDGIRATLKIREKTLFLSYFYLQNQRIQTRSSD